MMYIMIIVIISIVLCGLEYLVMKKSNKVLGILPFLGFGIAQYFLLPDVLMNYRLYRAKALGNFQVMSLSGPMGYLLLVGMLVIVPISILLLLYIRGLRKDVSVEKV